MSSGPPPVPGGRTPEEREAARREREARRADADGPALPVAPPDAPPDWLEEAERLTAPPARTANAGPPRSGRGRRWGRLVALALVVAAVLGVGWFALNLFQPFKGEAGDDVRVVVPEGSSLGDIAQLLEEEGVIASSSFFQLRARVAGRSGDLKPGPYRLQRDMAYTDVLDVLERGVPPNVVMVTIPEGRSRGEIAPLVDNLEGDYRRATRRSPLLEPSDYGAEGPRSLEGFLFPATYELKKDQPVRRLVDLQLTTFKERFGQVDLGFAKGKNLTAYDVLIIASLVEREAAVAKERRLIASVIYNRLKNDIRLDIDATTRFAVGNWKRPLRQSELQNPSPYNTRVHPGLPPGPIGNPGLASIEAAARPARTNFLFYVVKPGTCIEHNFSATDAEFQRDVTTYQRARAKRGGKSPTSC